VSGIYIVPIGSDKHPEGFTHFEATMRNRVPLKKYAAHIDYEAYPLVRAHAESGGIRVWGSRPGTQNVAAHDQMESGDGVYFYARKRIRYGGLVTATWWSEEMASRLWGRDGDGRTWECMFSVGGFREFDFDAATVLTAIGRPGQTHFQNFTRVDPIHAHFFRKELPLAP
jgi:hypothetical protein